MRGFLAALLLLCGLAAPAMAHPPFGLVVDPTGNIYFSDLETVWRLSPDGQLSVFRAAVPETHVHELALAPDGAIEGDQNHYDPATERFYTGLWRRTPTGEEQQVVSLTERPPPGAGVWQDLAGNRYVTQWISNDDRRTQLLRRRPDGRTEVLFDETGGSARPAGTSAASVGGIAFGSDGSLYFAAGSLLRRKSPDGNVTIIYDGGTGSSLRGLAAMPDGGALAADMNAKSVLAVEADGTANILYRETAAWLPTAVALADRRLFVLEANADPYDHENRVRLIEVKNGRARVAASPGEARPAPSPPSSSKGGGPLVQMILLTGLAVSAALLATWLFRTKAGKLD